MFNLTDLEKTVLSALFASAEGNGHDFGFIEDGRKAVSSPDQLGGVVASLVKKGLIEVNRPVTTESGVYTQFTWVIDYAEVARMLPQAQTIQGFVDALNEAHRAQGYHYSISPGRKKLFRVVQCFGREGGDSAYCFIDHDGNIYEAASWKAPAKGVRSTLATVNVAKVDPFGSWLYANRK